MARKNMYFRGGGGGGDERPPKSFRGADGGAYAGGPGAYSGPAPGGPDRNSGNPPCNTLFVGNLTSAVSDLEIENYFRNLQGDAFVTCKVNRSNPNRVSAFVQFADITVAQEVHDSQQGKELPGSDRGPMRIQFSKNPLGEFSKRKREEMAAAAAAAGGAGGPGPGPGPQYGSGAPSPQPADGGAPAQVFAPETLQAQPAQPVMLAPVDANAAGPGGAPSPQVYVQGVAERLLMLCPFSHLWRLPKFHEL